MSEDSVAATKKRRGRPTVYARDMYGDQEGGDACKNLYDNLFNGMSDRVKVNIYYYMDCQKMAEAEWGKEWFKAHFVNAYGGFKNFGIAEQIGRMHLQNKYSEEDCMRALGFVVELKDEYGLKAKALERRIRHGRNTGEWEW